MMATVLGNEPEREESMSDRQRTWITWLLEKKNVSALMASRLIGELSVLPDLNGSGLENLKERSQLPNT